MRSPQLRTGLKPVARTVLPNFRGVKFRKRDRPGTHAGVAELEVPRKWRRPFGCAFARPRFLMLDVSEMFANTLNLAPKTKENYW